MRGAWASPSLLMRCRPCQRFPGSSRPLVILGVASPNEPCPDLCHFPCSHSILSACCWLLLQPPHLGDHWATPAHPRHPCSDGLPKCPKAVGENLGDETFVAVGLRRAPQPQSLTPGPHPSTTPARGSRRNERRSICMREGSRYKDSQCPRFWRKEKSHSHPLSISGIAASSFFCPFIY
jgi:hypothetical protein